jgi:hypothetical protein
MYAWALGPQTLSQTGDGGFLALYGTAWMAQVCPDGSWRLYQRTTAEVLTSRAWDVEPPAVPVDARHPTLAFDQAARPAIAWEDATGIRLREFDEIAGQYQFIGPFAGRDPVLLTDATVNYRVGGSDVVLFYLSDDREKLMYRVQNENFAVEHEHHDFGAAVVLDAQDIGGYRFQLKYSDELGGVIPEGGSFRALVSDVYPIYVRERLLPAVHALEDGEYLLVVQTRTGEDAVTSTVGALADGVLLNVIIQREYADAFDGLIGSLEDGELFYAIIPRSEGPDPVDGVVGSLEDGVYFFVLIERDEGLEAVSGVIGSLEDGAYAAA